MTTVEIGMSATAIGFALLGLFLILWITTRPGIRNARIQGWDIPVQIERKGILNVAIWISLLAGSLSFLGGIIIMILGSK